MVVLPLSAYSQNLVVGYFNPNQILTIENTTAQYDTVIVINQGQLNVYNSILTINQALIVLGEGTLEVENTDFTVTGNSIFLGNSTSEFNDNLTFIGDLIYFENAIINIDSAQINIPMEFVAQYSWIGGDNAQFTVTNTTINLENGKLGGGVMGASQLSLHNTHFQSQSGIALTMGFSDQSDINVEYCTGGMEFIVSDSASLDIDNSAGLIIWHTFQEGSTADIVFPPSNSLIPYASDVTSYNFSGDAMGVDGLNYTINIENSTVIFWCILSDPLSHITINNSTILGLGLTFSGNDSNTISGFVNDSTYISYAPLLSDRTITLNNSTVKAWNFYPQENSDIIITNSIFGEALTFNNAHLLVENSICDGSGGYFGSIQNSEIIVRNSIIKRIGIGPEIIVVSDSSTIIIEESNIIGEVVVNNISDLYYSNSIFDNEPEVNDAALFVEAFIDSMLTSENNLTLPITGTLRSINGLMNLESISHYLIEYSQLDGSGNQIISNIPFTENMYESTLFIWDIDEIPMGEYLLSLTTYVNGDSILTTYRNVLIGNPLNGDVNGDGDVNVLDIVMTVNIILSSEYNEIGDMNNDGNVDVLDIVLIINLILEQ